MPQVLINASDFCAAHLLTDLLERRRVSIASGGETAEVFVASAAFEAAKGGTRPLIEVARAAGAKSVVIINEGAERVEKSIGLGGNLIRLSVTSPKNASVHDAAVVMMANTVGAMVGAMACADKSTGALVDMAKRVAHTDVTVFINGPTGSGKEVLARQVHTASRRKDAPFIAINCAAIPENMLEAILFGHEKGAFTGAAANNKGIIRAADGGTLLLDEISEMPMGLQSKLLRVIQERTVTPIGTQKEVPVDIRIIATSNRDMPKEVRERRFREDLFYRLNVFPLATKSLGERKEDIPVLAATLIERHVETGQPIVTLSEDALAALMAHSWPGNVRELENVIQRALVLCSGTEIAADDLIIDAGDCLALTEFAEVV